MAYQNTRERELDGLSAAQEEKVAKVLSEVNKAISDRVNKAYSGIAKAISAPPMLNFKIDLPLFGPPKHMAAFARLQSIAANSIRKPLEDLEQQIDNRIRAVSIDFDILGPKWKSAVLKRLKELEIENSRLKRLLADAELDKAMLKEALRGNG
jgi:hypothetical protein